jgi:hypothetical protein
MIELTTFSLMVGAMIVAALGRDYWRARQDRVRATRMDHLVAEFTNQPLEGLVLKLGAPFEIAQGLSERALYVWKSPPNDILPRGSGLLTVTVTVEADCVISEIAWRDHIGASR